MCPRKGDWLCDLRPGLCPLWVPGPTGMGAHKVPMTTTQTRGTSSPAVTLGDTNKQTTPDLVSPFLTVREHHGGLCVGSKWLGSSEHGSAHLFSQHWGG